MSAIGIDRSDNGKLAEHRAILDVIGLMQQLGVMPSPRQAPA